MPKKLFEKLKITLLAAALISIFILLQALPATACEACRRIRIKPTGEAPESTCDENSVIPASENGKAVLVDALLNAVEDKIVPLAMEGVTKGNKPSGSAILGKNDLLVVVAGTGNERENPLWHGEAAAINRFYELPSKKRPAPGTLIFLATHEPCPNCLSAITRAGYDNCFYLFSHEDSGDFSNNPPDSSIEREVFQLEEDDSAGENHSWKSYSLVDLIDSFNDDMRIEFKKRVTKLQNKYEEMSEIYQKSRGEADMP